ncbi:MAG TPA: tetratricopeptide repeat protein, partial [Xanthobacteraceae bacterium]
MSVDFTYLDASSYRAYLAGLHVREKIDIAIDKTVRARVGSEEEIYGREHTALREALRDFRYGRPDETCEVLTLNLLYACAAADPAVGDVVDGFHVLFDGDAAISEGAQPSGEPDADRHFERIARLMACQKYVDALQVVNAVLTEYPTLCGADPRFARLRAVLLAGIAGQPKSAATIDLPAAELAFLDIAARATSTDAAVAAWIAAGKCAYADGRFADAGGHYCAALDRDPHTGEANYQMARLRLHAGRKRAARKFLMRAFAARFSYTLRAASDPVFRADIDLVRACVVAATRHGRRAARDALAKGLARLRFLARHGDRDHPAEALTGFAPARSALAALAREPAATTLKQALFRQKTVDAALAPVGRIARDYCDVLRANEDRIALRGVGRERMPADAHRVAGWLTRVTEVSAVVVLLAAAAGFVDYASAAPFPDWHTTAQASAHGLAVAVFWLLVHAGTLRRPVRRFFE